MLGATGKVRLNRPLSPVGGVPVTVNLMVTVPSINVVTVDVLLAVLESVIPDGGVTVAVLVTPVVGSVSAVAVAWMMTVQTPPLGSVDTLPLTAEPARAAEQVAPFEPVALSTETLVKLLGMVSLKVAPLAALVPLLVTTN